MAETKLWIKAFRLRTLPLAMASIGMGSFLAAAAGSFNLLIFSLSILTTVFLQILSNLSNDYGDFVHGADSDERSGPDRLVQSGKISAGAMKTAMAIFVLLSLLSGLSLLYVAFGLNWKIFGIFLGLGIVAIIAAITYTSGSNPYGYIGLGDISVVLFFGLTGVLGSYYLFTQEFNWLLVLPSLAVGLFSTAVLNVNNIRDIESDRLAGKRSIPVRLGRDRSVWYHWILLFTGIFSALCYAVLTYESLYQFMFVLVIPLLFVNALAVKNKREAALLDPYLKQMAITTLLFVLTFGIGLLL